ncbi:MAG: rod shape-determining protein [Candidatus Dormibacteria bacterium]
MLGKKLAIDLGSSMIRVAVRGEGTLFAEPAIVGRRRGGGPAGMGLAALHAAADGDIELLRPLRGDGIIDPAALDSLLQQAITRSVGRQRIFRPDIVIAVSPALPDEARRQILATAARQGSRTTYLIDSPLAAALGASLAPGGRAHAVVDSGAGTVDVATIAHEGMVAHVSLTTAGEHLRAAVIARIQERHGSGISVATADDVVASILCSGQHEERRMTVPVDNSEPLTVCSPEFTDIVADHVRRISEAIQQVLDETPAVLRAEISVQGVILAGGGARLEALDRALQSAVGETVRVASDPQQCVLRGAAVAAENLDVLRRSFMYIR